MLQGEWDKPGGEFHGSGVFMNKNPLTLLRLHPPFQPRPIKLKRSSVMA